jgi:pimeloyl-ACP methyl ester carboxylesterase
VFPEPRLIETNDIRLAVYEAGPIDGKPVVLLHGFPELAFSWRHQMPALAAAGYRVIAVDQRGFGKSDRPPQVADYHMRELTADMEGLLDALGFEQAVFVGHDWGSFVVWSLPFYAPERVAGLASLNLPFLPRRPVDPITLLATAFGEDNYIGYFQEPGPAEALLEADVARSMRFFMRRPSTAPERSQLNLDGFALQKTLQRPEEDWPGEMFLEDEEMEVYVEAYEAGGFGGPLNYYRNMTANWQDMERFQPAGQAVRIDLPVLMLVAEKDPVLPPALAADLKDYCPQAEVHLIEGSGHWTQQEKPEEVNRLMVAWLKSNYA